MTEFRLGKEARDWFEPAFKDAGPLSSQFDKYYLCLLVGLMKRVRSSAVEDGKPVIDYWIADYKPIKGVLLGLLLKAELDNIGVDVDEKEDVQRVCGKLFVQEDPTSLTGAGMGALDRIADGGFKALAESFPQGDRPRSQFQLLTHVAELLLKE